MKRLISIFIIAVVIVPGMLLSWLLLTESGLQWSYHKAEPYLPVELNIDSLEGRLLGPITINGLDYLQAETHLKSPRITLDWQPLSLLFAKIDIDQLHVQALDIILSEKKNMSGANQNNTTSLPDIIIPWRTSLKNAEINGLTLTTVDQLIQLKKVRLEANSMLNKININELGIDGDKFSININGVLTPSGHYRHKLNVDWQTSLPSNELLTGGGNLTGDMRSTVLKQKTRGPVELSLTANLHNLVEKIDWSSKLDINKFNAHKLNADWPAISSTLMFESSGSLDAASFNGLLNGNHPQHGNFKSEFTLSLNNNTLKIDQLEFLIPDNKTRISASGQWKISGTNKSDIKLALDWNNLQWPLLGVAEYKSNNGQGTIDGNINNYTFNITSDSLTSKLSVSDLTISGQGTANGITVESLKLKALKGNISSNGQLNWSPELNWNVDLSAKNIDPSQSNYSLPGLHLSEWQGQLNAKLSSQGQISNNQIITDVKINQIDGQLRNYPFALKSQLKWHKDTLDIIALELNSGDSFINATGHIGQSVKLNWDLKSSHLAELYPHTSGSLHTNGFISGSLQTPLIKSTFNGKDLVFSNYSLASITGNLTFDLTDWQALDAHISASNIKLDTMAMQSLELETTDETITALLKSNEATVKLQLKGKTGVNNWRGQLENISIQTKDYNHWQLDKPVNLYLARQAITVDMLCLKNNEQASFCTQISLNNSGWHSSFDIKKLPLQLFSQFLPPDLKLMGLVNGTGKLQLKTQNIQSPLLLGNLQLDLPAGELSYPLLEGERDHWKYRSGTINASLNEQGLKATSVISIENGDHLGINFELPGADLLVLEPKRQNILASADFSVHDLGLIEALVPEVQDLQGHINAHVTATGTLAEPRFSGQASLLNGKVRIPVIGLNINQLKLNAKTDNKNKLNYTVSAHSGEGELSIKGHTQLDSKAGWESKLIINGNQFDVSSIPEARVSVSPELEINLKNNSADIKGHIHIPYARLQPKDITTASHTSPDAVILGGEQPAEEKWLITTRIKLSLGERVHFFGYGFEGRLGGSLLLEDEPGQLTKATGEINIPEGRYRAYGQRLDIEKGRLLFTGSPLKNPGLDLRAVRHTNNVVVGLKVKGSLNKPQLELFSSPTMGQTDTLSYLLLGRPMETSTTNEEGAMMTNAALALGLSKGDELARILGDRFGLDEMRVESSDQGDQASLVVGRYLSPKLYVSYGVGLIESINTISLRYQISDKWQLKSESGDYTGADILYTIER